MSFACIARGALQDCYCDMYLHCIRTASIWRGKFLTKAQMFVLLVLLSVRSGEADQCAEGRSCCCTNVGPLFKYYECEKCTAKKPFLSNKSCRRNYNLVVVVVYHLLLQQL